MLQRALERFRAEDWRAALPLLERAHAADPADLDVALLCGISFYRLERYEEAVPLLEAAAAGTDEETRASARIFLALLAAARGDTDTANAMLRDAAASTALPLAEAGRELLRTSAQPSHLSVSLLVRPEYDSNVPLVAGMATPGALALADRADGNLLLLGAAVLRPFRRVGLSFEEVAAYRQQFRSELLKWSLFVNTVAARYRYLGAHDRVGVDYEFDALVLGGHLLGFGHDGQAAYRRAVYRDFGLAARYLLRYRDYVTPDANATADFSPFTGAAHLAAIEASWGTAESPHEVVAAGQFIYEGTTDATYTAMGGGARVYGRMRVARRADLVATMWFLHRAFDAATACGRRDWQVYGELSATADLAPHVGLVTGVNVLRNVSSSTDPACGDALAQFDYLKMTAWLGVVVGWAGL